jgi:hypothetical protein
MNGVDQSLKSILDMYWLAPSRDTGPASAPRLRRNIVELMSPRMTRTMRCIAAHTSSLRAYAVGAEPPAAASLFDRSAFSAALDDGFRGRAYSAPVLEVRLA